MCFREKTFSPHPRVTPRHRLAARRTSASAPVFFHLQLSGASWPTHLSRALHYSDICLRKWSGGWKVALRATQESAAADMSCCVALSRINLTTQLYPAQLALSRSIWHQSGLPLHKPPFATAKYILGTLAAKYILSHNDSPIIHLSIPGNKPKLRFWRSYNYLSDPPADPTHEHYRIAPLLQHVGARFWGRSRLWGSNLRGLSEMWVMLASLSCLGGERWRGTGRKVIQPSFLTFLLGLEKLRHLSNFSQERKPRAARSKLGGRL